MLTAASTTGYAPSVTANSVADLGRSNDSRRTSATTMKGAFFVPAMRYGGCARDTFGCAGFLESRSANPRTVAPISCLAAVGDDSTTLGVRPMATPRLFPTCNPSARAAAHRAMARAALFSDSSAATRLKRYNHHMSKVRHLEARGGLPLFVIYLARSTTRLEIYAPTWQDALRQTGSADACLVNQAGERAFEVTFDPDSPTIIDFRLRYGSADDALRAVLAHVVHQLDAQALSESTRRTLAECADGMEPGAYSEAAKQAERPELSPTARRRLMRAYDVLRLEQQRQGGES